MFWRIAIFIKTFFFPVQIKLYGAISCFYGPLFFLNFNLNVVMPLNTCLWQSALSHKCCQLNLTCIDPEIFL